MRALTAARDSSVAAANKRSMASINAAAFGSLIENEVRMTGVIRKGRIVGAAQSVLASSSRKSRS